MEIFFFPPKGFDITLFTSKAVAKKLPKIYNFAAGLIIMPNDQKAEKP